MSNNMNMNNLNTMNNMNAMNKSSMEGSNINTNGHHHQHQQHQHNSHHSNPESMSSSMSTSPHNALKKPSTTITRPPRAQNGHHSHHQHPHSHHNSHHHNHHGIVSHHHDYVNQVSMARHSAQSASKPDDYDPDSNVYVANLPSDYGKERLYQLFSKYGSIVRYKFVTPDEPSQPGYGFVQFQSRKDAHKAIKNLEGHVFGTGETIYLSIALRRRSSLSDEPTNLYIKNLPSTWTNEKLRKVFGAYGQIRQSKVVGDGIGFVRFEDHDQALNAIGRLDKQMVEEGCKLEVRFATRKTAANAYRLQQIPSSKTNENNLYIRNLPKYYNQSALEALFANYGKISSAKINDNGIAFVRFAHAEDAKRAIQELNGKKPPQFEEEIVVKLAHFDIGDSRNRWANKFSASSNGSMSGSSPNQATTSNGNHFNQNMYQNHFNAPIGSMNSFNVSNNFNNPYSGAPSQSTASALSSVPSTASFNTTDPSASDVNVNVNMQNLNVTSNVNPSNMQNMNMMNNINMNNQMQALQQQMQQWNLTNPQAQTQGNGAATAAQLNQFAFPAATPVMMAAPQLFANPQQMQQQQQQQQQQNTQQVQQQQNGANGQMPSTQLPRQVSSDSNVSATSNQSGGATSPQSNGSNDANKQQTWSKKQQQLGDKLYQKVFNKTGIMYAPKITGMLIKMGDKKAQQCIDDPSYLDEQIQIAKKLLDTTENVANVANVQQMTATTSPQSLLNPHGTSPTAASAAPLNMNKFNLSNTTPTSNRFQQLNTKPVTPNTTTTTTLNAGNTTPNAALTPNQATNTNAAAAINLANNPLAAAQLSSIPNLLTSSIPNSILSTMPIFNTPQLFAMNSANNTNATTAALSATNAARTPQSLQTNTAQNNTPNTATTANLGQLNAANNPQYLFTTVPNLGSTPVSVTSPVQQQMLFTTSGTPGSIATNTVDANQQAAIQNSGWGLALNQGQSGGINVIPTQNATQFMNPGMFRTGQ